MDIVRSKIPTCSRLLQRLFSGEGLSDGLSFAERQKKHKEQILVVQLERWDAPTGGEKMHFMFTFTTLHCM